MRQQLIELFQRHAGQAFSPREILKRLGLPATQRAAVRRALKDLAAEGRVRAFRNQRYGCEASRSSAIGVLSVTLQGTGYVAPDVPPNPDEEEMAGDVLISRQNMGTAIHGDRVEAHVVGERFGRREGYVVRVIERRSPTLVGRFLRQRKGGIVLPRNRRIDRNIVVAHCPPRQLLQDDQWVVVRITQWTAWPEPLYGRIEQVLGSDGDPGLDVLLIVRDHGVAPEFPPEVEREAAHLPAHRSPAERREDLRNLLTVTIDPEGAKDHDDAVSLEVLDGRRYRLGVHIADVSHYVRDGGAVDREALERATSIYPVDRVIPMLPERLSSDLCSLRPNEDRLAVTVLATLDSHGRALDHKLFRSVIRSRHRLTYRQVQDLFDGAPHAAVAGFSDAHNMLLAMRDLAAILASERHKRGCLDLDIPEVEIVLDSAGRVRDVRHAERWESHRLVEQFMILANEIVAQRLTKCDLPVIYRVHEPPNPEKIERLRPFLKTAGVSVPGHDGHISQRTLQHILDGLERMEAGPILRSLVLRAMMRAVYSSKNVGHYGLGSSCYCHFTSPIRRYPDLIVHRVLCAWLDRGLVGRDQLERWREEFEEVARRCSEREERAQEIERDVVKVKSLEFMRRLVGEEFDGVICGVLSFGFFVELKPYPVEGLVHVRDLSDDYYNFDEERLSLVGERRGRTFKFADGIRVVVTRVDLINLQMDLVPADLADQSSARRRKPKRRA